MAYENLCMYCFEDMQGQTTCPHCGRDSRAAVPQVQMLPGSRVYHERFLIGRALGQDATGIVYAAFDTKKENKLRIREYLPRDCAERLNDGAVVPMAGKEDEFEAGIKKLRASVESVEDPRKRHFFFEENGTAYIAQRKAAAASADREEADEGEEEGGNRRRIFMFVGIAVAVLVVAAVLLITVFNGAVNPSRDLTQSPTLDPSQVWIPATTPTATPYVAPTFAALVDPELSWMEYTYEGDVEQEYQQAQKAAATPSPTPAPTPAGGTGKYKLVTGNSSRADITALQQKLAELGWLDKNKVTGKYDSDTYQAVKDFQSYINQRYSPKEKLTVDGAAGPKTLQWLYEVGSRRPSPTPAPKVTPRPEDKTVDDKSSAEQVREVQQMLITLGLLPENAADGRYGASTVQAVRKFQQRVNELQGYDVLTVSGRVDPQSMAFLTYYAEEWARLRQATAVPTATPAPTVKPTPTPTTRPVETLNGVIDANSPVDAVRKVQQLLIDIGMLPTGSADGKYGNATIGAVADFQQWVNIQRGEQTLTVNGEVDQLTLAYLQYCKDHGLAPYGTQPPAGPTAAPTATPTAAPAAEPEGDAPDDEPEEPEEPEESGEITVDASSDPDSIRYVQQMLAAVGAMDESGVDGVYGRGTTRAVQAFQEWVNSTQGGSLPVTGAVDNATRLALEYAYDHDITMTPQATAAPTEAPTEAPTQAPTEAPTPEPTEEPAQPEQDPEGGQITVGEDSDPESIRYVQQMLQSVGALAGGDTGVYDEATVEAVKRFQAWVNSIQGDNTLPVTGYVDDRTRQALEYASDRGYTMNDGDQSTPEPQGVGAVGDVAIRFGDVLADGSVIAVPEGAFSVQWRADGDVDSYYIYVTDSQGNSIVSQENTDVTSFNVNTQQMVPGEVYTMRLGVLPTRGGEEDIVWQEVQFTLPQLETPVPEPTEAPTEEPTEAPTPEPTVAAVAAPSISIAGVSAENGPVTIEGDTFQISWSADGAVSAYRVRIADENGNEIASQTTDQTSVGLRANDMREGVIYSLSVGAIPVNGTEADMVSSTATFTRPVPATPEPTEAPTPEPQPTAAPVGKPVINLGGTAVQHEGVPYMTDSSVIISWNADGDVAGYYVYVENDSGEQHELSSGTDTSSTVSTASLPAGIYTIYVGAMPVGGTRDDAQWSSIRFGIPSPTAQPTEAPTPEPEPEPTEEPSRTISGPISATSDSETIQQLQMRLYSLGLLGNDVEPGVLDEATLNAVYAFQMRMYEQYQVELGPIDPSDPDSVIDPDTVLAIFSDYQ